MAKPPTKTPTIDLYKTASVDIFAKPAAQSKPQARTVADIAIPHNLRHITTTARRAYLHALNVANAAKHIQTLPRKGESLHCIMKGNYNGWDLVPAVLDLAAPAIMLELYVATLGFNRDNAAELLRMIDGGRIRHVVFFCSTYYADTDGDTVHWLQAELRARNAGRLLALRVHAKLLLMHLSDGRKLVNESSANLRSCRNIEQFCLCNDPGLHDFHKAWMDELLTDGDPTNTTPPPTRAEAITTASGAQ